MALLSIEQPSPKVLGRRGRRLSLSTRPITAGHNWRNRGWQGSSAAAARGNASKPDKGRDYEA
jgi:hypothetical protein